MDKIEQLIVDVDGFASGDNVYKVRKFVIEMLKEVISRKERLTLRPDETQKVVEKMISEWS